jgi:hypothetical protein
VCQKQGLSTHQLQAGCSRGREEEWTKNLEPPINQQNQVTEEPTSEHPSLPQERCVNNPAGATKIEPVHDCLARHSNPQALAGKLRVQFLRAASGGCECNRAGKTTSQMHKLRHVQKNGRIEASRIEEVQRGNGKATKTTASQGTRAVKKDAAFTVRVGNRSRSSTVSSAWEESC